MDATILRAIERSIRAMRENLGEHITIDDIARAAMFSKFHFSRVFQRLTGVSPGRFLSALRIEEAKRLLLCTSMTVADIGHQVGYNSIGTFSSRFSRSVGVAPIAYRQLGGVVPHVPMAQAAEQGPPATSLHGQTRGLEAEVLSPIFVGLFAGPIFEGPPVRYTVLRTPGAYTLADVPEGTWYLMAHSVGRGRVDGEEDYVGFSGPVTTRPDISARIADVRLRPARMMDPPLLLALPDLRSPELLRIAV
jgi:AraC-like DNA-binding protein